MSACAWRLDVGGVGGYGRGVVLNAVLFGLWMRPCEALWFGCATGAGCACFM